MWKTKKGTKILIGIVIIVLVVAVLAMAFSGDDDYDYRSQAEQEIDKYGYDSTVTVEDVEKGTNIFGVSLIKVTGTFVSDGETHSFVMTTYTDHTLSTLEIDGEVFLGDDMGLATYNFTAEEIGPFEYVSEYWGTTEVEEPEEGMTFVLVTLTVKNVGHEDGLTVDAPQFENSVGNLFYQDYSATEHHDSTYENLEFTKIGLGNSVTYTLVFEVPEGTADGSVHWSSMDIDLYGYMLDPSLEPA